MTARTDRRDFLATSVSTAMSVAAATCALSQPHPVAAEVLPSEGNEVWRDGGRMS